MSEREQTPYTEATTQRGSSAKKAQIMASGGYLAVMPVPGMPGAPFFEGANITEFLERYRD